MYLPKFGEAPSAVEDITLLLNFFGDIFTDMLFHEKSVSIANLKLLALLSPISLHPYKVAQK